MLTVAEEAGPDPYKIGAVRPGSGLSARPQLKRRDEVIKIWTLKKIAV